jgi:hypothetical protein
VLASLDEIPGVREARVDHDGVYFLFALEPDASTWAVVESAREFLPDAHRPAPKKEEELVESYLSGATWLRSGDTKELSREEAHILAQRHGQQAATFLGLDETKTKQMLRILDEETVAAFDRVHAAGGGLGPESHREFEIGTQRTIQRCKAFLDAREIAGLEEYLKGLLEG